LHCDVESNTAETLGKSQRVDDDATTFWLQNFLSFSFFSAFPSFVVAVLFLECVRNAMRLPGHNDLCWKYIQRECRRQMEWTKDTI
jgi:hypothetical protein